MDDPLLVRLLERLGDLPRDRESFVERERPLLRAARRASALDELHDQGADAVRLSSRPKIDAMLRMVERGEELRLALEARQALRVVGEAPPAAP